MKTYLVGGALRDQLLGLDASDKDWVVTGATPQQMLDQGFIQVGKDFPVFLHPKTKQEYALARTERKSGKGYTGFSTNHSPEVTLEEDLQRRDLTINAIAQDNKGNLIDPFHGLEDLQSKCLRHVSPAFGEDPLRVLRVARFAARFYHLGFRIAKETASLMRHMVKQGELNELVAERVWQETEKALQSQNPQVYFEVLKAVGALKILFPEIQQLFGVPQPFKWHPEIDCGIHTMMVLQQCAQITQNPVSRFAALCHDLGKGSTPAAILPSHKMHEMRSVEEIKKIAERLKIPNKYKNFALKTAEYHSHCHKVKELKAKTILKVIKAFDAIKQPENLKQFTLVCTADAQGRTGHQNDHYPQAEIFLQLATQLSKLNQAQIANNCANKADIALAIEQAQLAIIREEQKVWK